MDDVGDEEQTMGFLYVYAVAMAVSEGSSDRKTRAGRLGVVRELISSGHTSNAVTASSQPEREERSALRCYS